MAKMTEEIWFTDFSSNLFKQKVRGSYMSKHVVVASSMEKSTDHSSHLLPLEHCRFWWADEFHAGIGTARIQADEINDRKFKEVADGSTMVRDLREKERPLEIRGTGRLLMNEPIKSSGHPSLKTCTSVPMKAWGGEKNYVEINKPHNWNHEDYKDFKDEATGVYWRKITPQTHEFYEEMFADEKEELIRILRERWSGPTVT